MTLHGLLRQLNQRLSEVIRLWQLIKRWFGLGRADVGKASIDFATVFENLKSDPNSNDALIGTFAHNNRTVELRISPDDRPRTECLGTARKLLVCFHEMNDNALSVASDRLLSTYNENWREYSERQEDGSYKEVSRPILDRSTFEASMQISGVSVIGSMVEFMYSDRGLFHGHRVVVNAFDGPEFSETSAEIVG